MDLGMVRRAKEAHQKGTVSKMKDYVEGDFEKGEANGSQDALELIATTAKVWLRA